MPEYLSPGVYIEEIDTGAKPIEGVSTSTAGMLGVTERGPVNVPILLTSIGDFTRWFGEKLRQVDYSNGPSDPHCYLPHAVEGFFLNGGRRLYLARVLDDAGATRSTFSLHDRGTPNVSGSTLLLRSAGEGTGTVATLPLLYSIHNGPSLIPGTGTLSPGDRIRIGTGSNTEYRDLLGFDTPTHVPLNFPLSRSHPRGPGPGLVTENIPRTPLAVVAGTFVLTEAAEVGDQAVTISVDAADVGNLTSPDRIIEIGVNEFHAEHRFILGVTFVGTGIAQIQLDSPLIRAYAVATATVLLDASVPFVANGDDNLNVDANAGDRFIYVNDLAGAFDQRDELVVINRADPDTREVRRIGNPFFFEFNVGAYGEYPAGSVADFVTLADDDRALTVIANLGDPNLTLDDVSMLAPGDDLIVGTGVTMETVTVANTYAPGSSPVDLAAVTTQGNPLGARVVPAFSLKSLTAASRIGTTVVTIDNRVSLAIGDVIRIGTGVEEEFGTIAALPNPGSAPNAGTVVLSHALNLPHVAGTEVRRQDLPTLISANRPASSIALEIPTGGTFVVLTDGGELPAPNAIAANDIVRVRTPGGQVSFHRVSSATPVTELVPVPMRMNQTLNFNHEAGTEVVERQELIQVRAFDQGAWGNRLRVSVQDENPGLVSQTTLRTVVTPDQIRLASGAGVEAGTVLELIDPATEEPIDPPVKVIAVDRANNFTLRLAVALTPGQLAAQAIANLRVRSREFSLTARLLHQADPARPQRNEIVIEEEVFRNLSMDPRHSRYFQTIIGDFGPSAPTRLSDRREEGESWFIRVHDVAQDLPEPTRTTALHGIRLGPETLVDVLPNGRSRPARHALRGGDDSIGTLTDATYIGTDSVVPEDRTGLFSFRNVDDVSILACPGRTSPALQDALISHCEFMRFVFAVLDGPQPPNDTLVDVQVQRQQFDTKYAALYYPWALIPEPFPINLSKIQDYSIPPAGHVMGVYARTDIERGVHKAPANEVMRGITGLQRIINKGEHDILNAFPVNINVIRDFRVNNRSIRIFGGRVITSDSDWKYVNVRRLIIFIEKSLERGLQWVTFEPNAEPLWARVRRTIANFLRVVWRNGALEGVTTEEAYFVKCDRSTMTQTDIDSGRLIVVVGVAPVKPAEFVIVRIGLWTAHAEE